MAGVCRRRCKNDSNCDSKLCSKGSEEICSQDQCRKIHGGKNEKGPVIGHFCVTPKEHCYGLKDSTHYFLQGVGADNWQCNTDLSIGSTPGAAKPLK